MTKVSERRQLLKELNEDQFRNEALVPLLKKMGCEKVRERHGPDEYGKDITFIDPSPLGESHVAIVAKVGNISGAASGASNLSVVKNQINMAIDLPIEDVERKSKYRVNRVIVWTNGNISGNAQKQIIETLTDQFRNVDFKDGQATLELLEEYYPAFFTIRDPHVSEYYSGCKEFYSRLEEIRALGGSTENHRLPAIFVSPILAPFPRDLSTRKTTSKKEYSYRDLIEMPGDLVITGIAGSGKSTLLRHLLITIIKNNELKSRRSPIPILIEFKNLDLEDEHTIELTANSQFVRFVSDQLSTELKNDFIDGKVILLIDGLDELKEEDRIFGALERIRDFKKKFPSTRIIITTRLISTIESPERFSEYRILNIENLTSTQMSKFIDRWFSVDNQINYRLKKIVQKPLSLHGLPQTPLTLAIVAILYGSGAKELPANLTELFQKYTELVLGRWDESRDISVQFEWRVKAFLLQKIGWKMQKQRKLNVSEFDLKDTIKNVGVERGLPIDTNIFFKEVVDRAELLVQNDNGVYEFAHRSFQDYFSGIEIISQSEPMKIIIDSINDPWWSQAIFFACGLRPDNAESIQAIMNEVGSVDSGKLYIAVFLGRLAQAIYLAPRKTKDKAVRMSLDLLIESWDDICLGFTNLKEKHDLSNKIPGHLVLVGIYAGFGIMAFGSITLTSVLSDIAREDVLDTKNDVSSREQQKREWAAFLLSAACAECDNIDDFVRLYDSGIIRDPAFLIFGSSFADDIESRDWLDKEKKQSVKRLNKKLKKKVNKYKKGQLGYLERDPIPLPSPTDVS